MEETSLLITEARNPASVDLDQLDSLGIVTLMNQEDARVAEAVRTELPMIARAVDVIIDRLSRGGRLLYFGAGTSGRLGILDASECPPTFSAPPWQVQGIIAGGRDALAGSIEDVEDDVGAGEEAGLARIAQALDTIHQRTPGYRVRILLENTAGQGHQIGWRFEHLAALLEALGDLPIGICLDTAHAFAAGYDLATEAGLAETLAQLQATVGLERVRVLHLNDTRIPRGGRVDRHWHVGEGNLGAEAFRRILTHVAFRGCPLILETPRKTLEDDRRNLARVRAWVAPTG